MTLLPYPDSGSASPSRRLSALSTRPGPRPVRCFHLQLRVHSGPWTASAGGGSDQVLVAVLVLRSAVSKRPARGRCPSRQALLTREAASRWRRPAARESDREDDGRFLLSLAIKAAIYRLPFATSHRLVATAPRDAIESPALLLHFRITRDSSFPLPQSGSLANFDRRCTVAVTTDPLGPRPRNCF